MFSARYMRAVLRYGGIAIYTSSTIYIILVGKFSTHYMRDVLRYGVIIYVYAPRCCGHNWHLKFR